MAALRAGASGFLGKGERPAALLDGIRTVVTGESLLSAKATQTLISHVLDKAAPDAVSTAAMSTLTPASRRS